MPPARAKEKLPTVQQTSAGGAAFRRTNSGPEIVIVKIVPEMRWQLPKGLIDEGETAEVAALREVREEAGINAEIIVPIETIEYWFVSNYGGQRARYHKSVHFFLMEYRSGDVDDHDHEVAEARWVPIDEAIQMLEFKSEKDVVEKARGLIAAN
jgi:8-oxo-dGTP pyrophosphatase MutT (NUDIX family)